jgi:hypothetical protein
MNLEMYASACLFCCSVIKKHRACTFFASWLLPEMLMRRLDKRNERPAATLLGSTFFTAASLAHQKAAARRTRIAWVLQTQIILARSRRFDTCFFLNLSGFKINLHNYVKREIISALLCLMNDI